MLLCHFMGLLRNLSLDTFVKQNGALIDPRLVHEQNYKCMKFSIQVVMLKLPTQENKFSKDPSKGEPTQLA